MKEKFIVEVINNGIVKCETECGKFIYIPVEVFPKDLQEGDIVERDIQYSILKDETRQRKERIDNKLNHLINKKEEN